MKNLCNYYKNLGKSYAFTKNIRTGFLTLLTLCITVTMQAQSEKLTIHLNDTTVEAVINVIRQNSDINFIYNHEVLHLCQIVSVNIDNGTIDEVLEQCFKNCGLTYQKVNSTIIIKPKEVVEQPAPPSIELTQTLRGTVSDRDSKITLPFANVIILNTNPAKGTTTDVDGNFTIEDLPVGRYNIQVSYVGYEEAVIPEIQVGSAREVILNIELSEQTQNINEVKLVFKKNEPLNQMAAVSARSFSVEESKRYAASISDPARMALSFAGVGMGSDEGNEIVIRGNSPNWMLWRVDGIEVPSPNHFAEEGYTSGAVSILSTNMLDKSDFYTGAFPAEFGGALSGVFDVKLRNGNNQKQEFVFQAGVLGFDFSAEGPLKKGYNGSYLFNYRYSTLSLLNLVNIQVTENTLPQYQDLSFKLNLPTKKVGTFALWALGGLSDIDQKHMPDTSVGEKFEYGYANIVEHGMYAAGLTHTIFPDNKSYFKTVISSSMGYSSDLSRNMDTLGNLRDNLYDKLKSPSVKLNTFYNRKISSRLTIRAGANINHLRYNYFTSILDSETDKMETFLDDEGNTNIYEGYLQSKIRFTDNITLTAGAHYTHFELSSDNSIEPRLGLSFNLPNNQKLSFGYGMHSKNEKLPIYFISRQLEDGSTYYPNKHLKLTRATHYVASYSRMLADNVNLKVEGYYQDISNLPISNDADEKRTPVFDGISYKDTLTNGGKGRNFGVEFTIQKYFNNNYYFLITSSIFDSKYQPADGKWYNSKYNANYINNFVGGKEFEIGDNKMLGLNAKLIWSGGKRLLPLDLDASIDEGSPVYKWDEIYSVKAKDYFRVDLGIKYHIYKNGREHIFSLDLQNATNRINTWAQIYDSENEVQVNYPMTGLIPIFTYRYEF